jgi:hypothetical protein
MKRAYADGKRLALLLPLLACAGGLWLAPPAPAQKLFGKGDPRGVMVEEVRNDTPSFMVRVDVDHADRVYRGGEVMRVFVTSEKAGYLYLLYCDAERNMTCLFPNRLNQDNMIPAGQTVPIPQPGSRFALRIGPPYGQEVLKAIVSLSPLAQEQLQTFLSDRATTQSKLQGVKGVQIQFQDRPGQWAEHHVVTTTIPPQPAAPPQIGPGGTQTPPGQGPPGGPPRRVGVFVGISNFQSDEINDLKVSHNDAKAMAAVMQERCRLDQAIVLINEQATLANVHQAICQQLPAVSRPGDTVFIFWSGHGGRCADDNGDERDGYDEYLVPYDAATGDLAATRRTMLLDDTFGRWLQELDGRKLVIILDTCHSGGQHTQEKSLVKGIGDPPPPGAVEFDFLDGELARAKDIGQRETALMASSLAKQISFERKEGDLSAMTYFLVEQLQNGGGPITLPDAYGQLRRLVPEYVERNFPGTTQTPLLIDNTTPPLFLRP